MNINRNTPHLFGAGNWLDTSGNHQYMTMLVRALSPAWQRSCKVTAQILWLGIFPLLLWGALGTPAFGSTLPSPTSTNLPMATRLGKPPIAAVAVTTNSSLEAPVLAAGTSKYQSAFTAGERTAAVWTMTGGSGISTNGSLFTSKNPNAPYGTQVAFLQSAASMKTTLSLTSSLYRLRYWAAQRVTGTAPNLTLNKQRVRIKVAGVEVDVETPAQPSGNLTLGAYAEYVTPPFWVTGTHEVELFTDNPLGGDNTVFIDNIRIEPLRLWSNANDWYDGGGVNTAPSVPTENDDCRIDAGRSMVLWSNACKAGTVRVEGELLTGLSVGVNIALEARAVIVMGVGGVFQVGKPEFPFANNFTLTLKGGNAATENLKGGGTNVLMAMGGGRLDLHGAPKQSWTKLSATASVGATSIQVAGTSTAMGWAVNDQIVLAPSVRISQSPNLVVPQCEVRTITSVTPAGGNTTLGLNTALTYLHTGIVKTYANVPADVPTTVDERAEVGLLTHNVKVQGDGSPTGGHVMMMKDNTCGMCTANGGGFARVSNVQFYKMGQKQRLGRYPFHWHMIEADGAGQYLRDCSILNSFNRVLSIHGTDFAVVDGNVAYDHIGHGIFLEDGGEENNTITNNLIMGTRMAALQPAYVGGTNDAEELLDFAKNEAVVPTDNSHNEFQNRSPAAFWITNPNNIIDGNVAAGTMGTGYWFALPANPTGLSANSSYFNTRTPNLNNLFSFDTNWAHSCMSAFDVNDSLATDNTLIKNSAWRPTAAAHFPDFNAYANSLAIYSGIAGEQRDKIFYDRPVLADNDTHIRLADYGTVLNSLIVANSGSGAQAANAPRICYQPYDGAGRLKFSHIIGFNTGTSNTMFNSGGAATNHPNHLFQSLTYADSTGALVATRPRVKAADQAASDFDDTGYPKAANQWGTVVRDVDGTTAKFGPNRSLISNHRMMRTSTDVSYVNSDAVASNVWVSDKKFALLYLAYPNGVEVLTDPPRLYPNNPDVTYTRTGGAAGEMQPTSFIDKKKDFNSTQMPVIVRGASAPYNTQAPVTYACSLPFVPAGANTTKLVVHMKDMDPGDISPIIKLTVGGMPLSTVTANVVVGTLSPVSLSAISLATLQSAAPAASGHYRDITNNALYIRLVNPTSGGANSIKVNLQW